ncbi:CapA family protein, partial [Acinetobacter oleivorans]|nr:CapA family protein [Acinetobacter oleivorans]
MKYQPVEIKLLAHIDTTSFDEDLWQFEFDDDISTLLLIDYALEQFQQKSVQAQDDYVVPEHLSEQLGQQNLGLKHSEHYTFTELLQLLIFTQAADVKDALSDMLCGTDEQAYLILSKRAATYNLNLKKESTKNQLKYLFLLVKNIYSQPAEIRKLFFIKELNFKGKSYLPQTLLMAQ